MVHYFNRYQFSNIGEQPDYEDLRFRFADYPEHLTFDLSTKQISAQELQSETVYNYFKFCKLVAHSYVDNLDAGHERDFQTWQYSLTQNKKETTLRPVQYIKMQIDWSPLTMKITKTNNSLSKFLVSLCAIIGGVFVIFGMLNSAVQWAKRVFNITV